MVPRAVQQMAFDERMNCFSGCQQKKKNYCGCNHWDIPALNPKWFLFYCFCFFVFFFVCLLACFSSSYILFQKMLEEWLHSWKIVDGNGSAGDKLLKWGKRWSLYSFFWKSCRVVCVTKNITCGDGSTWETRSTGKREQKAQS